MSVLSYRWQLEFENIKETRLSNAQYSENADSRELKAVYHKVSVDSIHKHCLIVPFENNNQYVMEIVDQSVWASCFSIV